MSRSGDGNVFERLCRASAAQGGSLWQLLDPERLEPEQAAAIAARASDESCDAFLIGASSGSPARFAAVAAAVRAVTDRPVLIFPNGASQVVPDADAILFMSLLSGRNPDYLVGEQVKGAPLVEAYGLETIPTGYLLIESGRVTTVQRVSNTEPIPCDAFDSAYAHCLTARYFGMRLVYLEAGSGAVRPVPVPMVRTCARAGLPLAVGGGIRAPREAAEFIAAGARFIVIGTRFEPEPDWALFREFIDATHAKTTVAF